MKKKAPAKKVVSPKKKLVDRIFVAEGPAEAETVVRVGIGAVADQVDKLAKKVLDSGSPHVRATLTAQLAELENTPADLVQKLRAIRAVLP